MGGKAVPAETVQTDHVMGLQIHVPLDVLRYLVASMYTYTTRYGLRLARVEMAVFTSGPMWRSPESHRPRMTSQAGHLDDPSVGAQLATWYHSGGGLLARDWFTGAIVRGEKWSARGRTGTACHLWRRTVVRMMSQRRRRRCAGRRPLCCRASL